MTNRNSPATKHDIELLMEQIGKLYVANERWKQEIIDEIDERIATSETQTKAHFDLIAEAIRTDFQEGAIPDRLEQHEDRIKRLERHTRLAH